MLVLKVIERGERRDNALKWRMGGHVHDALAAGVHGTPVAEALDEFLAAADSHRVFRLPPDASLSLSFRRGRRARNSRAGPARRARNQACRVRSTDCSSARSPRASYR